MNSFNYQILIILVNIEFFKILLQLKEIEIF
jgi:hypothetical protein